MGLVFMVISIMDILLYAKVSPFYSVLQDCICYCLQKITCECTSND